MPKLLVTYGTFVIAMLHKPIYIIPLNYFSSSTLVSTHAHKIVYFGSSEYPMITNLAIITHAQKTS